MRAQLLHGSPGQTLLYIIRRLSGYCALFSYAKCPKMFRRRTGSSTKYEPLPRYLHVSERVGRGVIVQGGRTNDFSEGSRQHLTTVVEIFDPYSETWEQRQVKGDAPSAGTLAAGSASFNDYLFSFGGNDDRAFLNTVHRLDTKTWCWCELSPQNSDGAPMPKWGCGMIAFGNHLGVFGGYGVPGGPTDPRSFIKDTDFTDGSGITNEFHIYHLSEGITEADPQSSYANVRCNMIVALHCRCMELSQHNWRETSSLFGYHLHCSGRQESSCVWGRKWETGLHE